MAEPTMEHQLGVTTDSAEAKTRALFEAVLAVQGEKRRALLEQARSLAPTVCAEVESLLMYHEGGSGLLDEGAPAAAARLAPMGPAPVPASIGKYTIVRELGHGGMGVVYEATQDFPKRRVALKVIRPELIGRSTTRRFEHEAEALASVQHPAIAQLFEAGFDSVTMPDGTTQGARVAYMAMELVEGRPLTEACTGLTVDAKVELLARVCDAVDHAHRRGVIHRDLKPGNILVGPSGQPKVLDFGIAKLTDRVGPATIETHIGQIVGTVGYMSPEQLDGTTSQIDLRSDVYALGVLMYEALAGVAPIEVAGMSLAAAASAVRQREPIPLGRRVNTLRGDLEAIAAHSLEKDPDRRYASAADLAQDLRRSLRHEPVSARPLTAFYHAGKFARRHRGLVASLGAVMLSLAGGVVAFAWQAREARAQAEDANSSMVFLTEMMQFATPEVAQGRDLTMRDAVDRAEGMLEKATDMHPRVRANLHHVLGQIYERLYEQEKSLAHYLKLADLRERLHGETSSEGLHARMLTVWPMYAVGRHQEAWELGNVLMKRAERILGPGNEITVDLHSSLATTASEANGLSREEVLDIQRRAVSKFEAHYGPDSEEADRERMNHAVTLMKYGDPAAGPIMRASVAWRVKNLGEEHPSVLVAMSNLGGLLCNAGEFDEGLELQRRVVVGSERVWGPTNRSTIRRRGDLMMSLFAAGKHEECERVARRQAQIATVTDGPTGKPTLIARGMLTSALIVQRRFAEADLELESLFGETSATFGEQAPETVQVATLRFDLCEQRRDAAGMKKWALFLKDTQWGAPAMQQAIEAEARFAKEDAAKGK